MPSLTRPQPDVRMPDDVFTAPMLLGSTKKSSFRVKNTFVEVPLCTPEPTKNSYQNDRTWTCPANLSKALAFEETPDTRAVATSAASKATSTIETPLVREVIPPTPSPVHAWELQRQSIPLRIAALSFEPAKPCQGERSAAQVDTAAWPTLFEHSATVASADVGPMVPGHCGEPGQQEDSDDGSSDDEDMSVAVAPPADVPKPPPGALHPSIGSERHALGACRRCCFFPRGRCLNGYDCEFCHYEHDKRKRKNKTKKRAEAYTVRLPQTMYAPHMAYGSAAQRSWMYPPHLAHQPTYGYGCGAMAQPMAHPMAQHLAQPMAPMGTTPAASVMGYGSAAYGAPAMVPPMQPQPCMQQYLVPGAGSEVPQQLPPQAAAGMPFGRPVIQLPPAVSEQAGTDGLYRAPASAPQDFDFELSPPPPPPAGSPTLPQICAAPQLQPAFPPPPPPASPRLASRDAARF